MQSSPKCYFEYTISLDNGSRSFDYDYIFDSQIQLTDVQLIKLAKSQSKKHKMPVNCIRKKIIVEVIMTME